MDLTGLELILASVAFFTLVMAARSGVSREKVAGRTRETLGNVEPKRVTRVDDRAICRCT